MQVMRSLLPRSNRYEYHLKLHSPAILGSELSQGSPHRIPGIQLKALFRRRFEEIVRTQIDSGTSRLWGDTGIRGIAQVSDAISEQDPKLELLHQVAIDRFTGAVKTGALFQTQAISSGTLFKGTILLSDHLTLEEEFLLRLSVRGFHSIGRSTVGGLGSCEIHLIALDETTENIFPILIDADASSLLIPEQNTPIIPQLIESAQIASNIVDESIRNGTFDPSRLSSREFEEFIAELLQRDGYEVELTPRTRDGGFDMLALQHNDFIGELKFIVECKKYAAHNPVTIEPVRSLLGVAHAKSAHKALLVTTSRFTRDATKFATENQSHLQLRDFTALREWLAKLARPRDR